MAEKTRIHEPSAGPSSARLRAIRYGIVPYGIAAWVLAVALWGTYQFVEPAPPDTLRIATGSRDGAYYRFADALSRELSNERITLEILKTAGSVANLELLAQAEVDVAFVQSGIANADAFPMIEGLGSVYQEPIWIFSRSDARLTRFEELQKLRVAIGIEGSGTQAATRQLLTDSGIDLSEMQHVAEGGMIAANALLGDELDALVTVASVNAESVQRLLSAPGIQLMDLKRADAFARRYHWLSKQILPEGVISLADNIPSKDLQLVSTAATLVAHRDIHPALADLMMQAADTVFSPVSLFSDADEYPSRTHLDFPVSAEAERYYKYGIPLLQRYLPFWAANLIDRMKVLALPLVALMLPLTRILPPAYRWTVRKKVYRWYDEVQMIDQNAADDPAEGNLRRCLERLAAIENDARHIDVPLGYAHELYVLRQHIELLRQQIGDPGDRGAVQ